MTYSIIASYPARSSGGASAKFRVQSYDSYSYALAVAGLLEERCPPHVFTVENGKAFAYADCSAAIRDCAGSFEVERLASRLAGVSNRLPLQVHPSIAAE